MIVEEAIKLGDIVIDGDTLYWNEIRPSERGVVEAETSDLARLSNEAGDFGEDYPGFTWEITVEEADLPDLRRIHAAVRWVRRGVEREVKLSRLLYTAVREEGLQ